LVVVGQKVAIWNLQTRKRQGAYRPFAHPSHLDIAPSGLHAVVKSTSGALCVMTLDDKPSMRALPHRFGEGSEALFSADGEAIVDGCWGGQFTVWSAATGKPVLGDTIEGAMITSLACDARREQFVFHRQPMRDGRSTPVPDEALVIRRWPIYDNLEITLGAAWGVMTAPAFSPDGRHLAVAQRRALTVIDVTNGVELASRALDVTHVAGQAVAWSPDATWVACIEAHQVSFFDAGTLERRARYPVDYACDVAFSPDGRQVALGSWADGVLLAVEDLQPFSDSDEVARGPHPDDV
jgi:WD40 repeat protein